MQRPLRLAALAFFSAAVLGACGSRGPLDDDIIGNADAGTIADAGADQQVVADSAPPIPDAGFDAGTGLLQCGTCVAQQCGTGVATCLGDAACRAVFQCVVTTCLGLGGLGGEAGGGGGGGGIDPTCLLGCASGGGSGVGEALGVFQCITGDCGNACGGLLGGLGGLGGFPDPAPPQIPALPSQRRAMALAAFSAWPELTCETR